MNRIKVTTVRHKSLRLGMTAEQSSQLGTPQDSPVSTSVSRTRVVSFRITEEQHMELVARCKNSHGEHLLTPSEYARYTVLHQRIAQPNEQPLERYRLAIAAQLATSLSDIVQYLESASPDDDEKHIPVIQHVCAQLARIQESILLLIRAD